jgi:segregation and condensation protein B
MKPKDLSPEYENLDVVEIISAAPIGETPVEDVVETVPGVVAAHTKEVETSTANTKCDLHLNGELKKVLECMLFVSTEPLSAKQIADALQIDVSVVEDGMSELEKSLEGRSGIQLMRVAGGYQLCTRPEYADYCAMILQNTKKRLSKAALETLAVIAYRQPCTQPEIEAVRGVSVDGVIKTLIDRGLVKEAGRKAAPGRPILYATTSEFLEYFGLNDISELPDIDMLAVEEVKSLEAQKKKLADDNQTSLWETKTDAELNGDF